MTTDEALQEIILRLQLDCAQEVSEGSGNSISTVYNWRNHGVKKPHLATFEKFLKYYGYRFEITVFQAGCNKPPEHPGFRCRGVILDEA